MDTFDPDNGPSRKKTVKIELKRLLKDDAKFINIIDVAGHNLREQFGL